MSKKIIFLIIFVFIPINVYARQGCCSHHGGVAGCSSSGMQLCNDGTLSKTCTCTPSYVYGCTDKEAKNYNKNATKDNGSCKYYIKGCTDEKAINYNKDAEKDDGSCIIEIKGCTDKTAENYNEKANIDDGSCEYVEKLLISSNEIKENSDSETGNLMFLIYSIIAILIMVNNKIKNNTLILKKIKSDSKVKQIIFYFIYFISVIGPFVDIIYLIINIAKKVFNH